MTRTETENTQAEVQPEAQAKAQAEAQAKAQPQAQPEAEKQAPVAGEPTPEKHPAAETDAELYMGLLPRDCKTTALEMVLLANPGLEESGLRVEDFATEAFVNATALQRTAMRFRMTHGASEADARASVAGSKGIDMALLFGVPSEAQAVAEVLFGNRDRKRKE